MNEQEAVQFAKFINCGLVNRRDDDGNLDVGRPSTPWRERDVVVLLRMDDLIEKVEMDES